VCSSDLFIRQRFRDIQPGVIAKSLADEGICIWHGHNYAYEVVRQLGIDEEQGVVRVGLAHYNTEAEIDKTLATLEQVLQQQSDKRDLISTVMTG
jgi:selenocysteine lyase/cysteine desulfurase